MVYKASEFREVTHDLSNYIAEIDKKLKYSGHATFYLSALKAYAANIQTKIISQLTKLYTDAG